MVFTYPVFAGQDHSRRSQVVDRQDQCQDSLFQTESDSPFLTAINQDRESGMLHIAPNERIRSMLLPIPDPFAEKRSGPGRFGAGFLRFFPDVAGRVMDPKTVVLNDRVLFLLFLGKALQCESDSPFSQSVRTFIRANENQNRFRTHAFLSDYFGQVDMIEKLLEIGDKKIRKIWGNRILGFVTELQENHGKPKYPPEWHPQYAEFESFVNDLNKAIGARQLENKDALTKSLFLLDSEPSVKMGIPEILFGDIWGPYYRRLLRGEDPRIKAEQRRARSPLSAEEANHPNPDSLRRSGRPMWYSAQSYGGAPRTIHSEKEAKDYLGSVIKPENFADSKAILHFNLPDREGLREKLLNWRAAISEGRFDYKWFGGSGAKPTWQERLALDEAINNALKWLDRPHEHNDYEVRDPLHHYGQSRWDYSELIALETRRKDYANKHLSHGRTAPRDFKGSVVEWDLKRLSDFVTRHHGGRGLPAQSRIGILELPQYYRQYLAALTEQAKTPDQIHKLTQVIYHPSVNGIVRVALWVDPKVYYSEVQREVVERELAKRGLKPPPHPITDVATLTPNQREEIRDWIWQIVNPPGGFRKAGLALDFQDPRMAHALTDLLHRIDEVGHTGNLERLAALDRFRDGDNRHRPEVALMRLAEERLAWEASDPKRKAAVIHARKYINEKGKELPTKSRWLLAQLPQNDMEILQRLERVTSQYGDDAMQLFEDALIAAHAGNPDNPLEPTYIHNLLKLYDHKLHDYLVQTQKLPPRPEDIGEIVLRGKAEGLRRQQEKLVDAMINGQRIPTHSSTATESSEELASAFQGLVESELYSLVGGELIKRKDVGEMLTNMRSLPTHQAREEMKKVRAIFEELAKPHRAEIEASLQKTLRDQAARKMLAKLAHENQWSDQKLLQMLQNGRYPAEVVGILRDHFTDEEIFGDPSKQTRGRLFDYTVDQWIDYYAGKHLGKKILDWEAGADGGDFLTVSHLLSNPEGDESRQKERGKMLRQARLLAQDVNTQVTDQLRRSVVELLGDTAAKTRQVGKTDNETISQVHDYVEKLVAPLSMITRDLNERRAGKAEVEAAITALLMKTLPCPSGACSSALQSPALQGIEVLSDLPEEQKAKVEQIMGMGAKTFGVSNGEPSWVVRKAAGDIADKLLEVRTALDAQRLDHANRDADLSVQEHSERELAQIQIDLVMDRMAQGYVDGILMQGKDILDPMKTQLAQNTKFREYVTERVKNQLGQYYFGKRQKLEAMAQATRIPVLRPDHKLTAGAEDPLTERVTAELFSELTDPTKPIHHTPEQAKTLVQDIVAQALRTQKEDDVKLRRILEDIKPLGLVFNGEGLMMGKKTFQLQDGTTEERPAPIQLWRLADGEPGREKIISALRKLGQVVPGGTDQYEWILDYTREIFDELGQPDGKPFDLDGPYGETIAIVESQGPDQERKVTFKKSRDVKPGLVDRYKQIVEDKRIAVGITQDRFQSFLGNTAWHSLDGFNNPMDRLKEAQRKLSNSREWGAIPTDLLKATPPVMLAENAWKGFSDLWRGGKGVRIRETKREADMAGASDDFGTSIKNWQSDAGYLFLDVDRDGTANEPRADHLARTFRQWEHNLLLQEQEKIALVNQDISRSRDLGIFIGVTLATYGLGGGLVTLAGGTGRTAMIARALTASRPFVWGQRGFSAGSKAAKMGAQMTTGGYLVSGAVTNTRDIFELRDLLSRSDSEGRVLDNHGKPIEISEKWDKNHDGKLDIAQPINQQMAKDGKVNTYQQTADNTLLGTIGRYDWELPSVAEYLDQVGTSAATFYFAPGFNRFWTHAGISRWLVSPAAMATSSEMVGQLNQLRQENPKSLLDWRVQLEIGSNALNASVYGVKIDDWAAHLPGVKNFFVNRYTVNRFTDRLTRTVYGKSAEKWVEGAGPYLAGLAMNYLPDYSMAGLEEIGWIRYQDGNNDGKPDGYRSRVGGRPVDGTWNFIATVFSDNFYENHRATKGAVATGRSLPLAQALGRGRKTIEELRTENAKEVKNIADSWQYKMADAQTTVRADFGTGEAATKNKAAAEAAARKRATKRKNELASELQEALNFVRIADLGGKDGKYRTADDPKGIDTLIDELNKLHKLDPKDLEKAKEEMKSILDTGRTRWAMWASPRNLTVNSFMQKFKEHEGKRLLALSLSPDKSGGSASDGKTTTTDNQRAQAGQAMLKYPQAYALIPLAQFRADDINHNGAKNALLKQYGITDGELVDRFNKEFEAEILRIQRAHSRGERGLWGPSTLEQFIWRFTFRNRPWLESKA